ncbi:unnamed protein product, partial [Rotaria sp. Silwood1]
MSQDAKTSSKATHDIIADGVSHLSNQAVASLPDLQNLKKTTRRIRQKAQNKYALPASRDTIIIPHDMTKTVANRTFL